MFAPEERPQGEVPTVSPVAEVLRRAAELIERDGWTQGTQRDSRGRMCALGAINIAAHGRVSSQDDEPARSANRALCIAIYGPVKTPGGPALWNNAPERTAAEVVAKLREVAAQVEREGA